MPRFTAACWNALTERLPYHGDRVTVARQDSDEVSTYTFIDLGNEGRYWCRNGNEAIEAQPGDVWIGEYHLQMEVLRA